MGIPLSVLFKRRINSGQGPVPEILSSAIKFLDQPGIVLELDIIKTYLINL
jgi:hypothetical protein